MQRAWDERYMRIALGLAREAAERGEVPVGAVIVARGRVVGWGNNTREGRDDVTGHAEVNALRHASETLGDWRLPAASTLYVTLEPCLMCAGALLQARVGRVVFGARDAKAGAVRSLFAALEDPRSNHLVQVDEGLLAHESESELHTFFEQLRRRNSGQSRG